MNEDTENAEKPIDTDANPLDTMSVIVRGSAFNKLHDLLDHLDTDEAWREFTTQMRLEIPSRLQA